MHSGSTIPGAIGGDPKKKRIGEHNWEVSWLPEFWDEDDKKLHLEKVRVFFLNTFWLTNIVRIIGLDLLKYLDVQTVFGRMLGHRD